MERENEVREPQWTMLFMHDIKQKMVKAWEYVYLFTPILEKILTIFSADRLISNFLAERLCTASPTSSQVMNAVSIPTGGKVLAEENNTAWSITIIERKSVHYKK